VFGIAHSKFWDCPFCLTSTTSHQVSQVGSIQCECQATVQGSLDAHEATGAVGSNSRSCNTCHATLLCRMVKDTTTPPPLVLNISPNNVDKLVGVDRSIKVWLKAVDYTLVSAIYSNGSHFKTRFIRRGKYYEADGMHIENNIQVSSSVKLKVSYEVAFAAHLADDYFVNHMFYMLSHYYDLRA
jgi:hypothetical protein